jgi:hypothetical protein
MASRSTDRRTVRRRPSDQGPRSGRVTTHPGPGVVPADLARPDVRRQAARGAFAHGKRELLGVVPERVRRALRDGQPTPSGRPVHVQARRQRELIVARLTGPGQSHPRYETDCRRVVPASGRRGRSYLANTIVSAWPASLAKAITLRPKPLLQWRPSRGSVIAFRPCVRV